MNYLRPQRPQSTLLATPPPRKMSTPAGDRLSTILEANHGLHSTIHELDGRDKSHWRKSNHSGKSWTTSGTAATPKTNHSLPRPSADTMPPLYDNKEWRAEHDDPSRSSKPGVVRRIQSRRGGLGRILIILAVILIFIIALGVGLGVGLSRRSRTSSIDTGSAVAEGSSSSGTQAFPLGQYTFATALRTVQTSCTSDSSTWRCYPYSTFSGVNSTDGMALFNWVLSTTSSLYATNATMIATNTTGIPANVSISSSQDPFSIALNNQSLTYINNENNPRFSFAFTYAKNVVPSTDISGNNIASTCYFNQTQFTATLYLSNSRAKDYPGSDLTSQTQAMGGYTAWPYAVEITESSGGGSTVPSCYANSNRQQVGTFAAQSTTSQCMCDYSNF